MQVGDGNVAYPGKLRQAAERAPRPQRWPGHRCAFSSGGEKIGVVWIGLLREQTRHVAPVQRESLTSLHDPAVALLPPQATAGKCGDERMKQPALLPLPMQNAEKPEAQPIPTDAIQRRIDGRQTPLDGRHHGIDHGRVPAHAGAGILFQRSAVRQHQPELADRFPGQAPGHLRVEVRRRCPPGGIVPIIDIGTVFAQVRRQQRAHGFHHAAGAAGQRLRPVVQQPIAHVGQRNAAAPGLTDNALERGAEGEVVGPRREESGAMARVLHAVGESEQLGVAIEDRAKHLVNGDAGHGGGAAADEHQAVARPAVRAALAPDHLAGVQPMRLVMQLDPERTRPGQRTRSLALTRDEALRGEIPVHHGQRRVALVVVVLMPWTHHHQVGRGRSRDAPALVDERWIVDQLKPDHALRANARLGVGVCQRHPGGLPAFGAMGDGQDRLVGLAFVEPAEHRLLCHKAAKAPQLPHPYLHLGRHQRQGAPAAKLAGLRDERKESGDHHVSGGAVADGTQGKEAVGQPIHQRVPRQDGRLRQVQQRLEHLLPSQPLAKRDPPVILVRGPVGHLPGPDILRLIQRKRRGTEQRGGALGEGGGRLVVSRRTVLGGRQPVGRESLAGRVDHLVDGEAVVRLRDDHLGLEALLEQRAGEIRQPLQGVHFLLGAAAGDGRAGADAAEIARGDVEPRLQAADQAAHIGALRAVVGVQLVQHQIGEPPRRVEPPDAPVFRLHQQVVEHLVVGQQDVRRVVLHGPAVGDVPGTAVGRSPPSPSSGTRCRPRPGPPRDRRPPVPGRRRGRCRGRRAAGRGAPFRFPRAVRGGRKSPRRSGQPGRRPARSWGRG